MDDLAEMTVTDASRALRQGDITAEAYASALLQRCEACVGLNAFISADHNRVLELARTADLRRSRGAEPSELHGVPLAVKDSINTKELPTTGGTNALRRFRPARDAAVVASLFEAGAILLGKTNLDELSLGWTSNNAAFGATGNPYDLSRSPGGSSGGTACAVSARMVPAGLGADTVGSVRVPSALCGVVGFRPTVGRYPSQGIVPIAPTFDTAGLIARSTEDIVLLDRIAARYTRPPEPRSLRDIRFGIPRSHYFADLDSSVERIIEDALSKLQEAGAILVDMDLPDVMHLLETIIASVRAFEAPQSIAAYLATHGAPISFTWLVDATSPAIARRLKDFAIPSSANSVEAYKHALSTLRPALRDIYHCYFRQHQLSAVVFPTVRVPAPPITSDVVSPAPDVDLNGRWVPAGLVFGRNVSPASAAGLPGLSIPAGLNSEGLPVGLELDCLSGDDAELLQLGVLVEQVLGRLPAPTAPA